MLNKLQTLVSTEHENLNALKLRKGHYSVRNVQKRDNRAARTRQELNETKKIIFQQENIIKHHEEKLQKFRRINKKLRNSLGSDHCVNESEVDRTRLSLLNNEDHVQQLMAENEKLRIKIDEHCARNYKKAISELL